MKIHQKDLKWLEMTKRKKFITGVLRRSLSLGKKIRLARKTEIMSGSLRDPVAKIKLSSNKMNGEIKRVEFSTKYVFRGQKKKKRCLIRKPRPKKFVRVSTPNNLFSQQNCKSETILFLAQI